MEAFARDLGYEYISVWAFMTPVEKVLTYVAPEQPQAILNGEDLASIDRLALRLDEALALASRHAVSRCSLQEDYMSLDVQGNVMLCCATTGRPTNIIGNYLDIPLADIQAKRMAHGLCGPCMETGLLYCYTQQDPAFDAIGVAARATHPVRRTAGQIPLIRL